MGKTDTFLKDVLGAVSEGIVVTDEHLNILYWNPFMEELSGRSAYEAEGRDVRHVLPSLDACFFVMAVRKAFSRGETVTLSAADHRHLLGGNVEADLKIKRVKRSDRTALLFEFTDVTDQHRHIDRLLTRCGQLSRVNARLKERKRAIERLAGYDPLTGVANRILFKKYANKCIDLAKKKGTKLGLMFVDVNEFKMINDTYGHRVGDRVMADVAQLLTESIRKADMVCRYGGDEFIILLPYTCSYEDFRAIVHRIEANRQQLFSKEGYEASFSFSIGCSFYPEDGETLDALIEKADALMYACKRAMR